MMPSRHVGKGISASSTRGIRYGRCCCHIRICVYVIGAVELLSLAAAVIALFALYEISAESFINRNPTSSMEEIEHVIGRNQSHGTHDSSESSEEKEEEKVKKGGKSSDSKESREDDSAEKEQRMVYLKARHRYYVRTMAATAIVFVIAIFVVAMMFHGLGKGKPRLLIPHMAAQVFALAGLTAVIILHSMWWSSRGKTGLIESHYPVHPSVSFWLIMCFSIAAMVFEAVSFWCVLMCYRYMKVLIETRNHSKNGQFWATYHGSQQDTGTKWASDPGMQIIGQKV